MGKMSGPHYVALHGIDEDHEMPYDDHLGTSMCKSVSMICLCAAVLSLLLVSVSHNGEHHRLHEYSHFRAHKPEHALAGPHRVPGWEPVHGDLHYDFHHTPKIGEADHGVIRHPMPPINGSPYPGFKPKRRHRVPQGRHQASPESTSEDMPLSDSSDSIQDIWGWDSSEDMPEDSIDMVEAEIEEALEKGATIEEERVDEP